MNDRDRIAEIIRNAMMIANPISQAGYAEADALIANGVTFAKDTNVITKIEVVVREHADKDWPITAAPATCGVKWYRAGNVFGEYVAFAKPEIPTDDLVKTINELLKLPFRGDDSESLKGSKSTSMNSRHILERGDGDA